MKKLSRVQQIIGLGAAHHRLLWIHPFYDGNGRVTRLMSHASIMRCGIGSSLWSVARGLAKNVEEYKSLLIAADAPRRADLDGRGGGRAFAGYLQSESTRSPLNLPFPSDAVAMWFPKLYPSIGRRNT
jgi:Fic family protein